MIKLEFFPLRMCLSHQNWTLTLLSSPTIRYSSTLSTIEFGYLAKIVTSVENEGEVRISSTFNTVWSSERGDTISKESEILNFGEVRDVL